MKCFVEFLKFATRTSWERMEITEEHDESQCKGTAKRKGRKRELSFPRMENRFSKFQGKYRHTWKRNDQGWNHTQQRVVSYHFEEFFKIPRTTRGRTESVRGNHRDRAKRHRVTRREEEDRENAFRGISSNSKKDRCSKCRKRVTGKWSGGETIEKEGTAPFPNEAFRGIVKIRRKT